MKIPFRSIVFIFIAMILSSQANSASDHHSENSADFLKWHDGVSVQQFDYQEVASNPELATSYLIHAKIIDPRLVKVFIEGFDKYEAALLRKLEEQLLGAYADSAGSSSLRRLSRLLAYEAIDLSAGYVAGIAAGEAGMQVASEGAWEATWEALSSTARIEDARLKACHTACAGARVEACAYARRAVYQALYDVRGLAYAGFCFGFGSFTPEEIGKSAYAFNALFALKWTLSEEAAELRKSAEEAFFKKLESRLITEEEARTMLSQIGDALWNNSELTWRGTLLKNHPHMQIMEKLFSLPATTP